MLSTRLRLVVTTTTQAEWSKHKSRFASKWLRSMYARRLVEFADADQSAILRGVCQRLTPQKQRDAALKDVHLLEAAIATDQRILSCDKEARTNFSSLTAAAHILSGIHWGNPTTPVCLTWIQGGVPNDRRFLLIAPATRRPHRRRA